MVASIGINQKGQEVEAMTVLEASLPKKIVIFDQSTTDYNAEASGLTWSPELNFEMLSGSVTSRQYAL